MSHLVLIIEIIAICILHAVKSNHSSEAISSAADKKAPVNIEKAAPSVIAFQR